MPSKADDPEFWRFRAEEARTIASDMKHAETKAIMARIAEDYERIAKIVEELRKQQYRLSPARVRAIRTAIRPNPLGMSPL